MLKRLLITAGALVALTACSPREVQIWKEWHAQDPQAASAFARNLPQASSQSGGSNTGRSVWDRLAECESGGNWSINTGNGYFGGLQFLASTWRAYGGTGLPHHHSREEQIRVAERLRADSGFAPWPACSRKLGLR